MSKFHAMSDFALDARLAADTIPIGDLALCIRAPDERCPVPLVRSRAAPRPGQRADGSFGSGRSDADAGDPHGRTRHPRLAQPDKVNVGALGNVVPQLHVHVVGRFRSDPAWPGPSGAMAPHALSRACGRCPDRARRSPPPQPDRMKPMSISVSSSTRCCATAPSATRTSSLATPPIRGLTTIIAGEVPILRRTATARTGLLPLADLDRVSPLEEQAFPRHARGHARLGDADRAGRRRRVPGRSGFRGARPALDRRAGRRAAAGAGHPGRGQALLHWQRAPSLLRQLRRSDDTPCAGFRRDCAAAARSIFRAPIRSRSCWWHAASAACSAGSRGSWPACIRASRVHRAGRDHRGCGAARDLGGGRACASARCAISPPSPAVSRRR